MQTVNFISSAFLLLCFSTRQPHSKERSWLLKKSARNSISSSKDKTMQKVVLSNEDFLDHMPDGGKLR